MANTETDKQPHQSSPAYRLLDVFVGRWETTGQQQESVIGSAALITVSETFEWLPGEFFLVHRFEGRVGDNEAACLEIIGHDAASGSYPAHTFYNNGIQQEWHWSETEGVWTVTGDWKMAGKPMQVRCTIFFSDGGNTMIGKWEYLNDEKIWETFWDVRATKIN
jgi:Protein of unknown function (DUF1579)